MAQSILDYYKRKDIQEAIVDIARDREIAVKYGEQGFGKRPDTLVYPRDVQEFAKNNATSFHCSEELWHNPLNLNPSMNRKEQDELRKGWDLVIDIDCKVLEYSGIAADLIVKALEYHDIKNISCKFSGNHGLHLAVPFEAFPEKVNGKDTKLLFPEAPRVIAGYLKEMLRKKLSENILKFDNIGQITKKTGKSFEEVVLNKEFNPYSILELDTVLISSRHLFRMPYSINEKSGWVSIPIDPKKILTFDKSTAKMENVVVSKHKFLENDKVQTKEARQLIIQAFDFEGKKMKEEIKNKKGVLGTEEEFESIQQAVPESFLPPCYNNIMKGVPDGKKRCEFILINMLSSLGWSYEQMEEKLKQWNEKNPEPLREVYLMGQLKYQKTQNKKKLPPNCANSMYYKDLQICTPDALCQKIKNPVNYAIIKTKSQDRNNARIEKMKEKAKENKEKRQAKGEDFE